MIFIYILAGIIIYFLAILYLAWELFRNLLTDMNNYQYGEDV